MNNIIYLTSLVLLSSCVWSYGPEPRPYCDISTAKLELTDLNGTTQNGFCGEAAVQQYNQSYVEATFTRIWPDDDGAQQAINVTLELDPDRMLETGDYLESGQYYRFSIQYNSLIFYEVEMTELQVLKTGQFFSARGTIYAQYNDFIYDERIEGYFNFLFRDVPTYYADSTAQTAVSNHFSGRE